MSLQELSDQGLFFNTNFLSKTGTEGIVGYRGELILVEGEVGDAKGHAKPPVEVMRGAVILEKDGEFVFLVGALDEVEALPRLIEKYQAYFSKDMKALIYVVNLTTPMQVEIEGLNFVLIPLVQGVPWNEVIDELALEKSDFKGQSAADKIVTVYNEFKSYSPKYKTATLDEALASIADIKREAWGAV